MGIFLVVRRDDVARKKKMLRGDSVNGEMRFMCTDEGRHNSRDKELCCA